MREEAYEDSAGGGGNGGGGGRGGWGSQEPGKGGGSACVPSQMQARAETRLFFKVTPGKSCCTDTTQAVKAVVCEWVCR